MKKFRWEYVMVLLAVLALSSCASQPKDQIMLMPAPDVYDQGYWDPFTDHNPIKDLAYNGILYATDRKPAQIEGQSYLDDRGHVLRLGIANIKAGKEDMTALAQFFHAVQEKCQTTEQTYNQKSPGDD